MADVSAPNHVNGILSTENRTWNGVGIFHTSASVSVSYTTGGVMPPEYAGVPVFSEGWQQGATTLDAADKANLALAFGAFSDVANITFTGFGNGNSADIRISTSGTALGSGFTFLPGRDFPQGGDSTFSRVFATDFTPGGFGFFVALHEFGRGMGLKAPTEGAFKLTGIEKTDQFSVMPAVIGDTVLGFGPDGFLGAFGGGIGDDNWPTTLLLYDIAALQWIYGANMSTRTGDDVYSFSTDRNHMAIWDAGGFDTINLENQTTAQIVNLNAGQFSSIGDRSGAGAFAPDNDNNVAIAFDVSIENAVGGVGNDTITGNALANDLNGWEGNDTIYGGAGDDIINGWNGIDTLYGGAGNDVYDIGEPQDVVVEGSGQGYDILRVFTSYTLPANVEEMALFSAADGITLTGGGGNDVMIGGDGDNVLFGGGGNDHNLGMGGDDVLDGGVGNDTLAGFGDNDTLYGGSGNDVLSGDTGVDVMYGGAGADSYFIDSVLDQVFETGGDYEIVFGFDGWNMAEGIEEFALYTSANVNIVGNALNNLIFGGDGANILQGLGGNDTIFAFAGADLIEGGDGNDVIVAFTGADTVFGGAGDDQIEGQEGADTLTGGAGSDLLFGGAFGDADRFVISFDAGFDAIRDFEATVDRIDVSVFQVAFNQLNVSAFGSSVLVNIAGLATVQIDNMNVQQINEGLFIGLGPN